MPRQRPESELEFPPVSESWDEDGDERRRLRLKGSIQSKLSHVLEEQARQVAQAEARKKFDFATGRKRFTVGK